MEPKEFSGRTEEDAVARACAELGLMRSELEYEIIDPGGKSLFGLKQREVVILARRREKAAPAATAGAPAAARERRAPEGEPDEAQAPQPGNEAAPEARPREQQPRAGDRGGDRDRGRDRGRGGGGGGGGGGGRDRDRGRRGGDRGGDRRGPRPQGQFHGPRPGEQRPDNRARDFDDEDAAPAPALPPEEEAKLMAEKTARGMEVLQTVLSHLGFDCQATPRPGNGTITISIDSGSIIEFGQEHPEALESLQFLLNKIVNRFPENRRRITLDLQGTRSEREELLGGAARNLGQRAREAAQILAIGPMNARDRRIVHLALKEERTLVTRSEGEGALRKLYIMPARPAREREQPEAPAEAAPAEPGPEKPDEPSTPAE